MAYSTLDRPKQFPEGTANVAALWQIDIFPAPTHVNRIAEEARSDAIGIGVAPAIQIDVHHGFVVQADITIEEAERIARNLLVEPVVESHRVATVGDA